MKIEELKKKHHVQSIEGLNIESFRDSERLEIPLDGKSAHKSCLISDHWKRSECLNIV